MLDHPYLEYVPLYCAGALNDAERNLLEKHLQEGCEICEPEILIFGEVTSRIPYSLANATIPQGFKERIRNRLLKENLLTPKKARSIYGFVLVAASVVALLLLGFLYSFQQRKMTEKEKQITDLLNRVQQQKQEIEWLRDPSVQLVLLNGLSPASDARGKIVWNPSQRHGIFYAEALPSLPENKSYQLWVIGSSGPVSAAVFEPDPRGIAVVTIRPAEHIGGNQVQFAVTVEPRGGVLRPTGSMILTGTPF